MNNIKFLQKIFKKYLLNKNSLFIYIKQKLIFHINLLSNLNKIMYQAGSQQREISSSIFEVDRDSQQINIDKHFFTKDTEIIKDGQRRKVVFGQMQKKQRTLYQILSPYMSTIAQKTGNFAYDTGSIAFDYLKHGFWWVYDKFTNKVVPYARDQIPKLIFIISKKNRKLQNIRSSEFCVLEMQHDDYESIEKQKNRNKGAIKVLIPLGQNDKQLMQQIKRNYEVSYDFPIDELGDQESSTKQAYYIPSESYQIMQEQVRTIYRQRSRIIEFQQEKILVSDKENQQKSKNKQAIDSKQTNQLNSNNEVQLPNKVERKDSGFEQLVPVQIQEKQKSTRKAIFLPGACLFIHEKEDPLYPIFQQRLLIDENVQPGYFVNPEKLRKSDFSQSQGSSGQCPLETVQNNLGPIISLKRQVEPEQLKTQKFTNKKQEKKQEKKIVDNVRNVRLQIKQENNRLRQHEDKNIMLN